jgi:hypothetical protein
VLLAPCSAQLPPQCASPCRSFDPSAANTIPRPSRRTDVLRVGSLPGRVIKYSTETLNATHGPSPVRPPTGPGLPWRAPQSQVRSVTVATVPSALVDSGVSWGPVPVWMSHRQGPGRQLPVTVATAACNSQAGEAESTFGKLWVRTCPGLMRGMAAVHPGQVRCTRPACDLTRTCQ